MPATPKRSGRTARPGSRFPSEVLAENIRGFRALRRMSQDELAQRMRATGHEWFRATVSEVERCGRAVVVDELLGLALVLGVTMSDLIDPTGVDGRQIDALDFSAEHEPMNPESARAWVRGKAMPVLLWDEGADEADGIRFQPAPEDNRTYSEAALRLLLERAGGSVHYEPASGEAAPGGESGHGVTHRARTAPDNGGGR